MLNKTRSIVLRHVRYGESSLIVTLYTERFGRISCMVGSVKSKKSRLSANLFQPLNLLETDVYYRQSRDLQRLREASCVYHYNSIPQLITKSAIALFLAEVLYLTLREEESNPSLFSFLFHALQLLDTRERDYANFHLWFMLHLTRFLGIYPQDMEFISSGSRRHEIQFFQSLPPTQAACMEQLIGSPQSPPGGTSITKTDRALMLDFIIRYYSMHIEGFSKLKSFTVLQEVFG